MRGIAPAQALFAIVPGDFGLFSSTFASDHVQDSPRDVRMAEDRSFEGVQPRSRRYATLYRPARRSSHLPKGEISQRDRCSSSLASRQRNAVNFSPSRARFEHRATFIIRTPWSERGRLANLLGSERFWKFCVLRGTGASLIGIPASHIGVACTLLFEPRGLYSPLKYVKLD